MTRPSLSLASFTLAFLALASPALAVDPTPTEHQRPTTAPDPWQEVRPGTVEEQEAEVLKAPAPGPEAGPAPAPPSEPTPPPRRPVAPPRPRRVVQAEDGPAATAVIANSGEDRTSLAIELGTSGFASGTLEGGLFIGARTSSGLIIGAMLDYLSSSVTVTPPSSGDITQSSSTLRFGAGARYPFLHSSDRRVELIGAVDAAVVYVAANTTGVSDANASGVTLAAGPGLRFWVHEHIAIGYVARLRLTHLSGDAGTLAGAEADGTASGTDIAFAGTFQILGVF